MQLIDERHRQKRSHLKVRTGCATCKTRRVKCDENRPECGRCRTANRKCVYAVPKTWLFEPKKETVPLSSQPTISFGSEQERRAFHFFREKTAPQLADHHETAQQFWCNFVASMATGDPLIFRLAVAMGARHEAAMLGSSGSATLATNSHTTAISTLARHLTQMRDYVTLLCCALLMGYANLCEEVPATAPLHFNLGLKILREETIPSPRGLPDSMRAYIDPMFAELEVATVIFRIPSAQLEIILSETDGPPTLPAKPTAFNSLYEAKQSLALIHRWMLFVTVQTHSLPHKPQYENAQIDGLLNHWRTLLIKYTTSMASKDIPTYHKARKMLFQHKLFVMCRDAATNQIFSSTSRVQMISIDFSRPRMTSVLYTLVTSSPDNTWAPLRKRNERERGDLDIWPQAEPAGSDGNSQIIRITLGD